MQFSKAEINSELIDVLRNTNTQQLFIIVHPLIDQKKNLFDFFYDSIHFVLSAKWVTDSLKLGRICTPKSFMFTSTKAKIGKINFKISAKMLKDILMTRRLKDPSLDMFRNTKIHICRQGMSLQEIESQRLLINALGGLYLHQFHVGLVDLVIVSKPTSQLAESIMQVYNQVRLINTNYLKDCLLYKRKLPEEEYCFHDLDLLIKNSYLLDKRPSIHTFKSDRQTQDTSARMNSQNNQSMTGTNGFNHPNRGVSNSGSRLGGNSTSYFLNRPGQLSNQRDSLADESQRNQSMHYKTMGSQSQNTLIDVPFKSFLFEKCLFYFDSKNVETFMYKKKVLEHSGSIVKNYGTLTIKQLTGRDFFFIYSDGFDFPEVSGVIIDQNGANLQGHEMLQIHQD